MQSRIIMKIFYTPTFYNKCKNLNEDQYSSTLLIPKNLIGFWNTKTGGGEHSLRDYLHLLLKKYRFLIYNGILHKNENLMTEIQKNDLNLQKVAIRPYPKDWAELKQLKAFFNKSICLIVVFLIMLDSLGVAETLPEQLANFGIPTLSKFRLCTKVFLSRKNSVFGREMQYRRDKFYRKV